MRLVLSATLSGHGSSVWLMIHYVPFADGRHRVPDKLHIVERVVLKVDLRRGALLILKHALEAGEGDVALGAFGLEAHPELEALDVAQVLAEGELLQAVAVLVVREADEAPDYAVVGERVSVGDHTHLDKVLRVHALLDHVVDAILPQRLHSVLVLLDRLLDVREGIFIELIGHLLVMVHTAQKLQDRLLDRGALLDL